MIARIVLFGVLVLAGVVSPAFAQLPLSEGEWYVTPTVGLALDGDADSSLAIAGSAMYLLTPNIAVEGEIGHVFDVAPGDADVDSSLTTVHGSAVYFIDTGHVAIPYLSGGLGIGKFSHDVVLPPVEINQTEIGFDLGGGLVYPLGDGILARGDLRIFKHIDNVPTVWRFGAAISFRVGN
jgi:hypothetical protein